MSVENENFNPAEHKETKGNTILIISHGGEFNNKVSDWVKESRNIENVEFISGELLPDSPPQGVNEVFIYSGGEGMRFLDKKSQGNWKGITFNRLVQTRDGSAIGFSKEPYKTADDIEVSNQDTW